MMSEELIAAMRQAVEEVPGLGDRCTHQFLTTVKVIGLGAYNTLLVETVGDEHKVQAFAPHKRLSRILEQEEVEVA